MNQTGRRCLLLKDVIQLTFIQYQLNGSAWTGGQDDVLPFVGSQLWDEAFIDRVPVLIKTSVGGIEVSAFLRSARFGECRAEEPRHSGSETGPRSEGDKGAKE